MSDVSRIGRILLGLLVFCGFWAGFCPAAEIDRLLAAVNGKVLTEGDLELARDFDALMLMGKIGKPVGPEEEIKRLIDLELMRQELESYPMAPEDQGKVEAKMAELQAAYAEIGGLPALLRRMGFEQSELAAYIRLRVSILSLVSFRFRPLVTVTPKEIQDYYQNRLAPELEKARSPLPSPAEVSSKIEEILREEKVNESMEQWIGDIRRHARIEYFTDKAPQGGG